MSDYRFLGLDSLYGEGTLNKLKNSHIAIIGIGGVGSWIAENLARSGVGNLTLIDLDDICFSNINRQVHALSSTAGQLKTQVMKKRVLDINPECKVTCLDMLYSEKSYEQVFSQKYDFVVDAFDHALMKTHLIMECRRRNQKLILTGGAAAKTRPHLVKVDDLAFTINDPLLKRVRQDLKNNYGLLKTYKNGRQKKKIGVPCIYSTEVIEKKKEKVTEGKDEKIMGSRCHGQGSVSFVTSHFANLACAYMIHEILDHPHQQFEQK